MEFSVQLGSIKSPEFLTQITHYQLLKEDCSIGLDKLDKIEVRAERTWDVRKAN
jgi:hypothetical protein